MAAAVQLQGFHPVLHSPLSRYTTHLMDIDANNVPMVCLQFL